MWREKNVLNFQSLKGLEPNQKVLQALSQLLGQAYPLFYKLHQIYKFHKYISIIKLYQILFNNNIMIYDYNVSNLKICLILIQLY